MLGEMRSGSSRFEGSGSVSGLDENERESRGSQHKAASKF